MTTDKVNGTGLSPALYMLVSIVYNKVGAVIYFQWAINLGSYVNTKKFANTIIVCFIIIAPLKYLLV